MDKMKNNLRVNRLFQNCPALYFFFAEPPNFFFILGYTTKIITIIAPIISTSKFMFLSLSPKSQEQSKISDMYICWLILIIYSIFAIF